jgi:hypothetical protein
MMLQPVDKARRRLARARFDEAAAAVIYRAVRRLFAGQHKRFLHVAHNEIAARVAKAEREGLWAWEDEVLGGPTINDFVNEARRALADSAEGAGMYAFNGIELNAPVHELPEGQTTAQDVANRLHTFATDYAHERAAELVGKRVGAGGELIDNPDAQWAVSDTTRETINGLVRDAVALHWDADQLADKLTDTGLFGDGRAEMIARTEISFAQNRATLEMARLAAERGIDLKKIWTVDGAPCPICIEAAEAGVVDLDSDFTDDAGVTPPAHPNCQCQLDLVIADDEEEPAEEEAKMQDLKAATRKRFARIFKDNAADDEDETDDDELGEDGNADHLVSQIADLLVEAGSSDGAVSREQALRWLLHTRDGQGLVARMAQHRKQIDAAFKRANRKGFTMTRDETLRSVVKRHGNVVNLAKFICSQGTTDLSEHELTALAVAEAKRLYPDIKDDARAFAKMFTDTGPTGATLRQAVGIAKAVQLEIMPVTAEAGSSDVEDDTQEAMEQLRELAERQRRNSPDLTSEQAFARAFKENPALARRAHRRPAATTHYPFPR